MGKRRRALLFAGAVTVLSLIHIFFVERSGELRWLARLNGRAVEPKGNQVLRGR